MERRESGESIKIKMRADEIKSVANVVTGISINTDFTSCADVIGIFVFQIEIQKINGGIFD